MQQRIIQLDPLDNVLVALQDLSKGESVVFQGETFDLKEDIPAKHKFFMRDMAAGESILMYGVLVGKTQYAVSSGDRMSTENTKHATDGYAYRAFDYQWQPPNVDGFKDRTFRGYVRSDGRVGTANYWLFIPTVFCENRNLDLIKEVMHAELGYSVSAPFRNYTQALKEAYLKGDALMNASFDELAQAKPDTHRLFPNIDGIKFLTHQGGCGGTRQDAVVLGKLLAAYADHPNVAGITILSLGCQNLQLKELIEEIKVRNPHFDKPLFSFEHQEGYTEEEMVRLAIAKTFQGLVAANQFEREEVSLDKLVLGVKCGGSDGFSGISANPAVGYAADLLVALGGKVLLAEFPELCGAEQNLIDRTIEPDAAKKFISLMQAYSQSAERVGSGFHMNPSPGNIRDGLITDAIKSMGAVKKGGTAPIVDVLDYTEPAHKAGLSLVCTPGNDVEATTGKAASGATLILFTTGLGTPTGNAVCPVIKVSSNTALAKRMPDIIDINTGPVIEGEKSIEQMGEEILEYCIQAASGVIVPKAVLLNQDDFIPWKRGVSL
ncbi:UxaA family hydrolase [Sphingobacterium hotanense]|uniref:UxaA family hydrolase n=1 Tax=Sphingobacterium hotanense TaxID=649196 RepID=UPI0021A7AE57|nr:altronate dehydratase family protein [Sphingobacterium hotanense]MCT1523095.1 altronate dehydratase family protein [Sphingobacterium hotanense]